jgi:RNA polymerase sigma-70 factor (ECF subfamily)
MKESANDKASGFEAARARLLALAYRMLGSRAEAEDVVQDVWLKWHLAEAGEIRTPVAWLTTVTARLAIDRLRHLQLERASRAAGWLPEPWLDDTVPSAEELALRSAQMSYGLMLLMERLKPGERAAFVLHEAFDCDYAEIAKILAKTPAACRQIVHRAKTRLQRAGAPLQRPDASTHGLLVERLREALETQDRAGLLRLFSDAPEVVSDAPVRVADPVSASLEWVETVTSLSVQAEQAEAVSIDGASSIALLRGGEITALLDVSSDDCGKIAALRIVTCAAYLHTANRAFSLAAVRRLLRKLQRNATGAYAAPGTLVAVCGNFPVDVDA